MTNSQKAGFLTITLAVFLMACEEAPIEDAYKSAYEARTTDKHHYYDSFIRSEGIPVYNGFSLAALGDLDLGHWQRRQARGAYIDLHGHQGYTGAYLLEVPPDTTTQPERHIYEELLYVVAGQGETIMWQADDQPNSVNLQHGPGGLLSPPMNSWHAHRNTGTEPLRILAFTNAPPIMDLYRDSEFVLNNSYTFRRRWNGEKNYFVPGPLPSDGRSRGFGNIKDPYRSNFVPDILALDGLMHNSKTKRADFAIFLMAGNVLSPHVSTWPAKDYQAAHHHNGGSTIILLRGEGYYLMWPSQAGARPFEDGHADQVIRGELRQGGMYSPPRGWYHQHFNTSSEEALYLAATPMGRTDRLKYMRTEDSPLVFAIEQEAAAYPQVIQIDEEDPHIRSLFEKALQDQ